MTPLPIPAAAALEAAIGQWLKLDPDTRAAFASLEGKVIAVELRGVDLGFYLLPGAHGLHVTSRHEGTSDTTLAGTPLALARLGLVKEASDALFGGDVEIRGDVEVGQRFRALLDRVHIDWEEQLSRLTGDVVAHHVGNVVRGAVRWGTQTRDTLALDVTEYLQEESQALPSRYAVEQWSTAVDAMRTDVDRLAARVARLQAWQRGE